MTLHRLLGIITRRWLVIAGMTLLGVVLAVVYTGQQPSTYQATAKLYVATTTEDKSGSDLVNSGLYASNIVSSVAGVAETPAVLNRVITSLDLKMTVEQLATQVTATVPRNTVLVEVNATAETAKEAADIANAVAQQLPAVVETINRPSAEVNSPLRLTVIQSAKAPAGRISPQPPLNVAVGLIVGLVVGLALAILLEAFRRRVRSVVEIEDATGLPVLGVLADDDNHPAAQNALRVVWSSVVAAAGHAPRAVLLASASESSYAPKLAGRLAPIVAQTERTVVWVDADLAGGRASRALEVEPVPGLSDVLDGQIDLEGAISPWLDSSLSVVPSGTRTSDLGRLFSSAAMSSVADVLRSGFETVVIDATGISQVGEIALLGQYVQGVVLIATPSSTRATLSGTAKSLHAAGLTLLGVVVDEVPKQDRADFERRFVSDDDIVYES